MKKYLIIALLALLPGLAMAQPVEEGPNPQEGKLRERMQEYIQHRLNLNRPEAERFTPVFIRYFRDFSQTHRAFKGDRLILQQKIIELRLRYRDEFRQIMDEHRANKVYQYEDEFRRKAMEIIRENRRNRVEPRPLKRNRALLL